MTSTILICIITISRWSPPWVSSARCRSRSFSGIERSACSAPSASPGVGSDDDQRRSRSRSPAAGEPVSDSGLLYGTLGAQSLIGGLSPGLIWSAPPLAIAAIGVARLGCSWSASRGVRLAGRCGSLVEASADRLPTGPQGARTARRGPAVMSSNSAGRFRRCPKVPTRGRTGRRQTLAIGSRRLQHAGLVEDDLRKSCTA